MQTVQTSHSDVGTMSLEIGGRTWSIEDVLRVASGTANVQLSDDPTWRSRIDKGATFLARLWSDQKVIYGVTTGYGDSCDVNIPPHLVEELPHHLTRYHGCGMGNILGEIDARAVMTVRLVSLAQGYSGVRIDVLKQLAGCLRNGIVPLIPEEGSVGASGDLTPLSYVAAMLIGERDVYFNGERRSASEVLLEQDMSPLTLQPKEGLALMNGTSFMTGLACTAYSRAQHLLRQAEQVTSLTVLALLGNRGHFDAKLFAAKPHPGQMAVASSIDSLLRNYQMSGKQHQLQDRYSVRCAPHVLGVLADALPWMRTTIETELNSANDNPLIDGETETVLHGGHFYGGHIAFAMDSLKNLVANIADLLDRQVALLVDRKANNGLPPNLTGANHGREQVNHGFKALQIAVSAWTAEALKQTMPASVFSRSTECHNQDKVSMGAIAARDAIRVLDLTDQVLAASSLVAVQAIELRIAQGQLSADSLSPELAATVDRIRRISPFLVEDRALESELRELVDSIRNDARTASTQSTQKAP